MVEGTINKKTYTLMDIKMFMLCVLSGRAEKEHVVQYLGALVEHGGLAGEDDANNPGLTYTQFFIEQSIILLDDKLFDDWIEYYKKELLSIENYELVNDLSL